MGLIKTLIHVHTDYSLDGNTSPEALARFARRHRIGCIAVTDHDTIEGALHLAAIADFKVIVGEEVSTRDGDLIGLFLKQRIQPGLSVRETALAIREQGGLVLVPHPFIRVFGCGLREAVWEIVDLIDAVEVCNAQIILASCDRKARHFAAQMAFPQYVGTDSHTDASIAPCHQLLRPFTGPADFLDALGSAELRVGRHPLSYFAAAACRTVRYLATGLFPPGFGANHETVREALPAPMHAVSAGA